MKKRLLACFIGCIFLLTIGLAPDSGADREAGSSVQYAPREIPARSIPVPTTVSDELGKFVARPLNPALTLSPDSHDQWRALVAQKAAMDVPKFERLLELFPVNIQPVTMGGVKAYVVSAMEIPDKNASRVLLHLHGGGYVFNGGRTGLGEAVLMAYHGKFKVVSVDYRMAPDFPYPAALDDAVAVYGELLKTNKASRMAIFGTSAGGGLAAATVLKLQESGKPLPGAVGLGTPWTDLTKTGDSLFTNEFIDNAIVGYDGLIAGCAKIYAGTHDMKDRFISPVYAEYTKEFPPTILTTGTRDLFLSDTVRLERKLRMASVETRIQVFEGMSHAQYISAFASPESREAFEEIAMFFDKYLEK